MPDLCCGDCGAPMVLTHSAAFGWFYACTKAPVCKGRVSAHQKTMLPMGTPADTATRRARRVAHLAFDQLWKKGTDPFTGVVVTGVFQSRRAAYRWLCEVMGKVPDEGHIGRFTLTECEALVRLAREKREHHQRHHRG